MTAPETQTVEVVAAPAVAAAGEQPVERAQAANAAGPEAAANEAKAGVLLVSMSTGSKFDTFAVEQTRFEHFESNYERYQEESSSVEYRGEERRERENQDQSEVQFNMDSALVRTVIGSGVVLMVMQGAQLAATLMAVNPTLMQFDPLSVMPGRSDKKGELTKGEKLFDK